MDITRYKIELTRHAFLRANERGITPDVLFAVIKGGRVEKIGKHFVKFSRDYKQFRVICVGKMYSNRIRIITVERVKK